MGCVLYMKVSLKFVVTHHVGGFSMVDVCEHQ